MTLKTLSRRWGAAQRWPHCTRQRLGVPSCQGV